MQKGWLFEALGLLRPRVSLAAAALAAAGSAAAHGSPVAALLPAAAGFLACGAIYAHNSMTDLEEDRANRLENGLAARPEGAAVAAAAATAGMTAALLVSPASAAAAAVVLALGFVYNELKLKKFVVFKNAFTGLSFSMFLFIGLPIEPQSLGLYAAASALIAAGSLVSDLRDARGDAKAGVHTVPVKYGHGAAKAAVYALLGSAAMLIVSAMGAWHAPFLAASAILTAREEYKHAHLAIILAILSMPLLALMR
jgi:4-hydroxybenzoate polyprenyltransferase